MVMFRKRDQSDHQQAVEAERYDHLCGLLRSARRYVEGYAENENNHPQARAGAQSLLVQIKTAIGR